MKKITVLLVLLFGFTPATNAQFFKKLGKKVERAAEKAIEKKAEQKTTKETEKAFDSTFNKKRKVKIKNKNGTSDSSLSQVNPADNYAFNHKIEMQIKSGKEIMDINYYLPKSGDFLSAEVKDKKIKGNFYTVFDIEREAMFTYMENGGEKMRMSVSIETDDTINESSFDITKTGNTKTILGYHCKEYRMTGQDMTATIWVTKDVDIRFPSDFYKVEQNKNNNQKWMKYLDGWAMEMIMIDTSNKKPKTITMNCLSIEKSNFIINSSDYRTLKF